MSLWSQPPRTGLWSSPGDAGRGDESLWTQLSEEPAAPAPPSKSAWPPQFNPLRRAHVLQAEEAAARERERRRQAEAAAASAHVVAAYSIPATAAPAPSTTSLFRLQGASAAGAIVAAHWQQHRDAQQQQQPVDVFSRLLAVVDAEAEAAAERSVTTASSPLSQSSATPSPPPRRTPSTTSASERSPATLERPAAAPSASAPAAAPARPPAVSYHGARALDSPFSGSSRSFDSSRSSVSKAVPTQQDLDELARQIEFIDRQLRGEAPLMDSPRAATKGLQSPGLQKREQQFRPATAPADEVRSPTTPLHTRTPRSQRDYLSANERRVLDQYKREQAWLEAHPDTVSASHPSALFDAAAASAFSSSPSPYTLDATKLDDSVPSTITEESQSHEVNSSIDAANRSVDQQQQEDEREQRVVDTSLYAPATASGADAAPSASADATSAPFDVDIALAHLPPNPPAAATAATGSLSSLMHMSDLAYPELLMQGYSSSRALPTSSPWKAKPIPNPLAPPPATVPSASAWMEQQRQRQREREIEARDKELHASMRARLHDGFVRILGTDVTPSSPCAPPTATAPGDPNANLLESLWAAEAEFERMMAEELPEVQINRPARQAARAPTQPMQAMSPPRTPKSRANEWESRGEVPHITAASPAAVKPFANSPRSSPLCRSQHSGTGVLPRNSSAPAPSVAFRPGALFDPRDEVKTAYLDMPLEHVTRPDLGGRGMQRALEEELEAHQRFLHVADLDAHSAEEAKAIAAAAAAVASAELHPPSGDVLLAVADFDVPPELAELLDVDLDAQGNLTRFQPASAVAATAGDFGRLVPMRTTRILNKLEQQRPPASPQQKDSSTPPLRHSHLHAGPDPVVLQRHIALRRAKESMREMDEELELLSQRAAALSAEYQSDTRAINAYEQRRKQREQDLLSIQLSRAQQLQVQQRLQAEEARATLQQIDDILDERQQQQRAPEQEQLQQPRQQQHPFPDTRSPPLSPHRRVSRSPSVHPSPRGPARHPEQLAALAGAASAPVPPLAASSSASVAARPSRIPVAQTQRRDTSKAKPRPPPVRKQRMAKLESDLDSALNQAQKLMAGFMSQLV